MDRWEQWRKQLARPASRMVFDKSKASTDSPGSWFGRITHGAPDEQWPECNGRAMWPLLQIVVPELPVRPATIDDLAMIRVYIDPEYHAMDTAHGQGWEVRASTTLDGLKPIVELGYPGVDPEEKMKNSPFEMIKSPSPEYADDPKFPLLMKDAFQVYECELNGEFRWEPPRETDPIASETFLCLSVKNILLKETFHKRLIEQKEFPNMPVSYGFRHNDSGARRFFFCSHNKPFPVPIPTPKGLEHNQIYYAANKMDPDVRFNEEACKLLVPVPKAFLKIALKGIIKEAKIQGVKMVDA